MEHGDGMIIMSFNSGAEESEARNRLRDAAFDYILQPNYKLDARKIRKNK
jgi:hypothetical protein